MPRTPRIIVSILSVFIAAALFLSPFQTAKAQSPEPPVEEDVMAAPVIEYRLDPNSSDFYQAPPKEFAQARTKGATIFITYVPAGQYSDLNDYCQTFPEEAKAAFDYAVNIWASQLVSSQPIEIEACWAALGSGVLGHSAPYSFYRNFTGSPQYNTWYPSTLVNHFTNSDVNELDENGVDEAEMSITYASGYANSFYYGTGASTPGDKINFATLVLHEVAHGLGFLGSMRTSGGVGQWGYKSNATPTISPVIYDRFAYDLNGTSLLNTSVYPNPSSTLGTALTSGRVFFRGPNAMSANGGAPVELYSPVTWNGGSSYSHLDESFNGTINALMTFSLPRGETNYSPGPVTMGLLQDIGWTLTNDETPTFPPTNITLTPSSVAENLIADPLTLVGTLTASDPDAGDTFTYSLVSGTGSTDNGSFTISGSQLLTNAMFNYEAKNSYSVRVQVTDSHSKTYQKALTVSVINVNEAPTGLALSYQKTFAGLPAGVLVGYLSASDPENQALTYSLPVGVLNNSQFRIEGDRLYTNATLDLTAGSTRTIKVRVTDTGSLISEQTFTIQVLELGSQKNYLPFISK